MEHNEPRPADRAIVLSNGVIIRTKRDDHTIEGFELSMTAFETPGGAIFPAQHVFVVREDMKRIFRAFRSEIDGDDPSIQYRIYKDGDQWCAVERDFVNPQESIQGFGGTPGTALILLQIAIAECKRKAKGIEQPEPANAARQKKYAPEDYPFYVYRNDEGDYVARSYQWGGAGGVGATAQDAIAELMETIEICMDELDETITPKLILQSPDGSLTGVPIFVGPETI